jgi:hypothetical protein
MSHAELERRVGHKVGDKTVMFVLAGGVYRRSADGATWSLYEE